MGVSPDRAKKNLDLLFPSAQREENLLSVGDGQAKEGRQKIPDGKGRGREAHDIHNALKLEVSSWLTGSRRRRLDLPPLSSYLDPMQSTGLIIREEEVGQKPNLFEPSHAVEKGERKKTKRACRP